MLNKIVILATRNMVYIKLPIKLVRVLLYRSNFAAFESPIKYKAKNNVFKVEPIL